MNANKRYFKQFFVRALNRFGFASHKLLAFVSFTSVMFGWFVGITISYRVVPFIHLALTIVFR